MTTELNLDELRTTRARSKSMNVIDQIAAERRRQVEEEGWTAEHDDGHTAGEIAGAAACYALNAGASDAVREDFEVGQELPYAWPWDWRWWKPKNRRRDLIRAAALIVAEIERLDRLAAKESADVG